MVIRDRLEVMTVYLKPRGGPYVPDGDSFWEFGVNEKLLDKANFDYEKEHAKLLQRYV